MQYWIYVNQVRKYARVHTADCSFCKNGKGLHGVKKQKRNGDVWLRSAKKITTALADAKKRAPKCTITRCGMCLG